MSRISSGLLGFTNLRRSSRQRTRTAAILTTLANESRGNPWAFLKARRVDHMNRQTIKKTTGAVVSSTSPRGRRWCWLWLRISKIWACQACHRPAQRRRRRGYHRFQSKGCCQLKVSNSHQGTGAICHDWLGIKTDISEKINFNPQIKFF